MSCGLVKKNNNKKTKSWINENIIQLPPLFQGGFFIQHLAKEISCLSHTRLCGPTLMKSNKRLGSQLVFQFIWLWEFVGVGGRGGEGVPHSFITIKSRTES